MSAMSSLISGADCGPSNALSSVVKHAEADRSLQRLHHLPATSSNGPSEADQAFARHFFDAHSPVPSVPSSSAAPFPQLHPSQIQLNVPFLLSTAKRPGALDDVWASKASRGDPAALQPHIIASGVVPGASQWSSEFAPLINTSQLEVNGVGGVQPTGQMLSPMMSQPYSYGASIASMHPHQTFISNSLNSNPEYAVDWESEFSKLSETAPQDKGKGRLVEVDEEGKALGALEDILANTSISEKPPAEGDLDEYLKSFERQRFSILWTCESLIWFNCRVWDEIKSENARDPAELSKLEAEYRQLLQQNSELDDTSALLERQEWDGAGVDMDGLDSDFGMNSVNSMTRFDENGVPILDQYAFEQNNPYLHEGAPSSLLDSAKKLMASNGSLDEAALLIEASIQKGEFGEGGYEAWLLLGRARSMDERETQALRALREGTRIAELNGAPGAGLLDLAISYTNESYDLAAHYSLRKWLRAKYPSAGSSEPATSPKIHWSSHELTTDAFISVARDLHAKGQMDPDVQLGLGVLFYSSSEYDKAKDCFESALQSRPDDYLMWNRLGSSLSNGSKPEEALGAYREALRLRPTYTRAIYNVGVACLNIGAYKEAAEHFLSALTLRGTDSQDKNADQIWQTLSRTFTTMALDLQSRPDLVSLTSAGDVQVFRGEFDF
ncbi:hypothetical protein BS47DRAFT_1385656 [Hydnum rufescens UP504]|uniref:Peroxin-5 n=1 Tax=Hydnum rufescens UP504 TaxID=1448309 RepID=A0A9P6AHX1_9AGAM|nr:hypothetical protein BS47DRAFT_1385656 [Hydnum rufescens UP504]